MKDILVNKKYRVDYKIAQGGFSVVYAGTDLKSDTEVAIKLIASRYDELHMLKEETEVYFALEGGIGIPRVFWYGAQEDFNVLVHERLGPTLEDLLNYCGRQLSLKTVLMIADQAISRIQYVHQQGFLHCDIKPDNFLLGVGKRGSQLYLIDFGLSKEWSCAGQKPRYGYSFAGTHQYASLNIHEGREQSFDDDMQSLGYTLVYLLRGSLPWQGLMFLADKGASDEEEKSNLVQMAKKNTPIKDLCDGLPVEFAQYFEHVESLSFQQQPDYGRLKRRFNALFRRLGYAYDNVYDWTEKRFKEMSDGT